MNKANLFSGAPTEVECRLLVFALYLSYCCIFLFCFLSSDSRSIHRIQCIKKFSVAVILFQSLLYKYYEKNG